MIENINVNQVGHLLGTSSPLHPDAPVSRPDNDPDAALNVRFADLLAQARQSDDDTAAVTEARELLESGQLTSTLNVESAARNILSHGI
jgi:hypothetical protein